MSEEIKKCDNCLAEFEVISVNKISQELDSMYCPFCSFELVEYVEEEEFDESDYESDYEEDDY
jgi:DNA-directed RNA polymerase subunit RPC12/RpoP